MNDIILVISSDVSSNVAIQDALKHSTVLFVDTYTEATSLLEQGKCYPLILMDLDTLSTDGKRLLNSLASSSQYRNCTVIVFGGDNTRDGTLCTSKRMYVEYLSKPIARELLIALVKLQMLRSHITPLEERIQEQDAFQDTLIRQLPIGVAITEEKNPTGQSEDDLFYVNPAFEQITGRTNEELIHMGWTNISHPDDIASDLRNYQKLLSGEITSYNMEKRYIRPDGTIVWVNMTMGVLDLPGMARRRYACLIQNITERKHMQEALSKSLERFRIAQEMSPDGFSILHPIRDQNECVVDFTWVYENPAIARMNGTDPEKVIGKRLLELFPSHQGTRIFKTYQQVAELGTPQTIEEGSAGESMVRQTWLRLAVVPMGDDIAILAQDLTERKQAEELLVYQRDHDPLTGLYNREYLENKIKQVEDENILPVSIIIVDTNGLKLVNDSFGHAEGDSILKRTANLLLSHSRKNDIVARYGGDEFVLVLPSVSLLETESLLKVLDSEAKEMETTGIPCSLAYGYAIRNSVAEKFVTIFKAAEDMMNRHKLYESSSAKNKTIGLIINSLFAKSRRESEHSKRVSNLCESIAKRLGMTPVEIQRMRIAGLMHDIGKIGISETILNKTGKLSEGEWEQMRQHPEIGYRILSASNEFADISNAILEHHERWDGKGYPRGLAGEDISVQGRIIAVADAFDAMTSERSYKQPMTVQSAIAEIQRYAGTQFDPTIAQVVVAQYTEFV